MRKIALLLAVMLVLSSCGTGQQPAAESSSSAVSSESSSSEVSSAASEPVASAPVSSEEASSEQAASSEAAASEPAASPAAPAAAEQAAAEQAAAAQAAADKAAAEQAAAAQAAAEQAAAEKAAADKAAAEQAAAEKAAADKAAADKAAADKAAAEAAAKPKASISSSNFLSKCESSIIKKTNAKRASLGLGELTFNEDLQTAARIRSKELYKEGEIAHKRPNGDTWSTVLKEDVPVAFKSAGENLCSVKYDVEYIDAYDEDPGSDADWWMEQWLNSDEHYANIVKEEYNSVGVGVYYIKRGGRVYAYATTLFAKL